MCEGCDVGTGMAARNGGEPWVDGFRTDGKWRLVMIENDEETTQVLRSVALVQAWQLPVVAARLQAQGLEEFVEHGTNMLGELLGSRCGLQLCFILDLQ
ncbi:hypothetical protein V6N13_101041 [Hibiscus sabdariffa]